MRGLQVLYIGFEVFMGNKVLIIEDARSLSSAIQEELRQKYEIQSDIAASLAEAKALLERQRDQYFVATVDLQLPDCERGQAAELTDHHSLPTIIFTGQNETNLRNQFSHLDLVDYVFKSASQGVHYVGWLIQRILLNRSLKVLVIEDSRSARAALIALLKTQGFQTLEAESGSVGLGLLNEHPDIIVLDEYLPDCQGHELCRDIRAREHNPLLQIIGVSSKGDKDTASIFLKCGGDDFIMRPFNAEEFTNRINHRADYVDQVKAHQKAAEEKNRFLGMAAHDLRNPVSFIQQACKRLERLDSENEQLTSIIDMLMKNSRNMQVLLDDLLDISAIEMGKLQLHKLPINLSDVVEERTHAFEEMATKKNISFDLQLPSSAMVEADPARISQVIDNLISNGIKYSPTPSVITISIEKLDKAMRFNIIDQGPGIAKEDQINLFKTFQRLGNQTTGGESSHGLGLAICLRIVNAHNGEIHYSDQENKGSHFYFDLPR